MKKQAKCQLTSDENVHFDCSWCRNVTRKSGRRPLAVESWQLERQGMMSSLSVKNTPPSS